MIQLVRQRCKPFDGTLQGRRLPQLLLQTAVIVPDITNLMLLLLPPTYVPGIVKLALLLPLLLLLLLLLLLTAVPGIRELMSSKSLNSLRAAALEDRRFQS